jgi:hypothetical protein
MHKIVSDGRRSIIFGMPWFTLDEGENHRRSATNLIRRMSGHYDLMSARKGEFQQYGIASSISETGAAKSGQYSAARIVADMVATESWLFVMEIEDAIWICCGRDGYILPTGDQIYTQEDKAKAAFQALSPASFKKVYVPESWKVARTAKGDELVGGISEDIAVSDIQHFIDFPMAKDCRLVAISPTAGILKASAALVLVGAAIGGAMTILGSGDQAGPTPEEIARQQAILQAQLIAEQESQYAQLDGNKPWLRAARPEHFLSHCVDAIRDMPVTPVGYEVLTVSCTGESVDANVKRTTGYTSWLEEWAETHDRLTVSVDISGTTGLVSRQLTPPSTRSDHDLEPFDKTARALSQAAQVEGSGFNLSQPTAPMLPDHPDYVPLFATSSFDVSTKRPDVWVDQMTKHPGIVINEIAFNVTTQIYKMEGKLYVPNR